MDKKPLTKINLQEIFRRRRSRETLVSIAKDFGRTKQHISKLCLDEGIVLPANTNRKVKSLGDTKSCEFCGKAFHRTTNQVYSRKKTCSKECLRKYLSNKKRNPEAKASKYGFVTLTCAYCGQEFERSKYIQAQIEHKELYAGTAEKRHDRFCSTKHNLLYQKRKRSSGQ